jgi:hypothetical protein
MKKRIVAQPQACQGLLMVIFLKHETCSLALISKIMDARG